VFLFLPARAPERTSIVRDVEPADVEPADAADAVGAADDDGAEPTDKVEPAWSTVTADQR
jgi:hypothetical protein